MKTIVHFVIGLALITTTIFWVPLGFVVGVCIDFGQMVCKEMGWMQDEK